MGGTGNFGLGDIGNALGWVERNIEAFGGDASRVTVAGQVRNEMYSGSEGTLFSTTVWVSSGIDPGRWTSVMASWDGI